MSSSDFIGAVLYTDGGCRPNPGYAGFGIHGYTFEYTKNVKGINHSTHVATANGYKVKNESNQYKFTNEDVDAFNSKELKEKILVIHQLKENNVRISVTSFIDAYGSLSGDKNTNNIAELLGIIEAIRIALSKNINYLIVKADSNLVVNGINDWVYQWMNNNWCNTKGVTVPYTHLWQELVKLKEEYLEKGNSLIVEWVKGHSLDIGNMSADWLATLAVYAAQKGKVVNEIDYSHDVSEYWESAGERRHPMLNHRYVYFIADINAVNKSLYFLGSQGKEIDLIAKKSSEAGYAVVQIPEGNEDINRLIDYQLTLKNELMSMCLIDTIALYGPSYRYMNMYGDKFLNTPNSNRYDVYALNNTLITRELRPPVIAMRAMDTMVLMTRILEDYLDNKADYITSTDITDSFYSTVITPGKKGKPDTISTKLNDNIQMGMTSITLGANVKGMDNKVDLILTSQIDIPDRNTFKRLENLNPKVHLVTWGNDLRCFHYAVIIECDNCRGIWSGPYSNTKVLNENRKI